MKRLCGLLILSFRFCVFFAGEDIPTALTVQESSTVSAVNVVVEQPSHTQALMNLHGPQLLALLEARAAADEHIARSSSLGSVWHSVDDRMAAGDSRIQGLLAVENDEIVKKRIKTFKKKSYRSLRLSYCCYYASCDCCCGFEYGGCFGQTDVSKKYNEETEQALNNKIVSIKNLIQESGSRG